MKVDSSDFKYNMVYIPDIYPKWRSKSDGNYNLDYFKNSLTGQVKTTRCGADNLTKRLFSDYFSSLIEQPSHILNQLERHSPIYVAYQRNPVLIIDNNFSENTGLFGGAIAIESPNFVDDATDDPA